ncbi:MAG: hypothetical protein JOZ47_20135 [Kutzneria sp.]|nr:hypothetical protein [Kutzneria sp.]
MNAPRPATVSAREAEVIAALGAGLSNAQIARRLHISVRTVEGHVSSLLRKYGVADRRALVARSATPSSFTAPGGVAGLVGSRTTFIGRHEDRRAVLDALDRHGLVTLVGPGGVGKTRVAEAVAEAAAAGFPYGAAFVDLVPVRHDALAQAVAAVLGVAEPAHQSIDVGVVERLGRGRSLLVLDNCEHLTDTVAAFVDRILAVCPVTVLATSRERLGLPGERVLSVAPLPLCSAEELFHDRAAMADSEYVRDETIVSRLCTRLDGLPLAIELAAARGGALGLTGLLTGLDDCLRLLTGGRGPVARHRSLRTVISWSHDLLTGDERAAFRRFSVFAGDFDLAAAAEVAGEHVATVADMVGRLVDKNLLTRRGGPAGRWRMLDTVRAFAAERLRESREHADVRHRHLCWASAAAADLLAGLDGDWHDRFDALAGDARAALAGVPRRPDPVAYRLASTVARLAFARRFVGEAVAHHRLAAQLAVRAGDAVRALTDAANCAQFMNDSESAFELHLLAADRAGDGDTKATAIARAVELAARFPVTFRTEIPVRRLRELVDRATAAADRNDPDVAARLACAKAWTAGPELLAPDPELAGAAVAAARAAGDPVLLSAALDAARTVAVNAGHTRKAHEITGERLALLDALNPIEPHHAVEIDDAHGLGCLDAVAAGDLPAAGAAAGLVQGLPGDAVYLTASKTIPALVLSGELDRAARLAEEMWESWRRAGRPPAFWMQATAHFVALAHGLRGDRDNLRRWRERAADTEAFGHRAFQARLRPLAVFVDARVAIHLGEFDRADTIVGRVHGDTLTGRYLPFAHAAAAELAVVARLPDAAARVAAAARTADDNDWAAACLLRAAARLDNDAEVLAEASLRWHAMGARFEHACTQLLVPGHTPDTVGPFGARP